MGVRLRSVTLNSRKCLICSTIHIRLSIDKFSMHILLQRTPALLYLLVGRAQIVFGFSQIVICCQLVSKKLTSRPYKAPSLVFTDQLVNPCQSFKAKSLVEQMFTVVDNGQVEVVHKPSLMQPRNAPKFQVYPVLPLQYVSWQKHIFLTHWYAGVHV